MARFGILVGGGPAAGINGVIAAATTVACRRGHSVTGILDGSYPPGKPLPEDCQFSPPLYVLYKPFSVAAKSVLVSSGLKTS